MPSVKWIDVPAMDALVVRRRLSGQSEVLHELRNLMPELRELVSGPPMALAIGFPRDGKTDYDLAFPVQKGMTKEGFNAVCLPALPMFTIRHEGPLSGGSEGTNLSDTWAQFVAFIQESSVLLGDDPQRFIYHAGADPSADDDSVNLEIQYSYHLPMWLDAFAEGISRRFDDQTSSTILAGSDRLAEKLDGRAAADWVHGAVERLDAALDDEASKACILNACAHHYIVQSGEIMQDLWSKAEGDLRRMLQLVTDEPSLGSAYWLDESGDRPLLMIRRRPARMEAYEAATDPVEKRYHACFCPLVRDSIRDGKSVSRTFCHCSGGWYVQEWEIVFGQPPKVSLVETMLEGADACVFAVTIPQGFLKT